MDLNEIEMVQQSFVQAALRARTAGLDGVEVLGSAGYLISQFLSPITNQRKDEYGGSWENRMRFGREVVDKVRQAVGPDFLVLVRIAGHDFMPGGNTNQEAAHFAADLEAGADDDQRHRRLARDPGAPVDHVGPPGAFTYLARGSSKGKGAGGGLQPHQRPFVGRRDIAQGHADLVGMARGLIADPYLPEKAGGNLQAIQHCIACNQGCFDEVFKLSPVTCLVNPRTGREKETPSSGRRKRKRSW